MSHSTSQRVVDTSSLLGILAGMAMLLPAVFVPEIRYLAVPGLAVLVPSLLFGMR